MFFSVNNSIKIAGKVYKPCICYEMPSFLEQTVRELAIKGKATIYSERKFFLNGAIYEPKKEVVKEEKKEVKVSKKSNKKNEDTETFGLPDEIPYNENEEGF